MRTSKIVCLIIISSFPLISRGQKPQRNISEILQTYYLYQDKDLVEKTIEMLNSPNTEYKRYEPLLVGFYGALFSLDPVVKNNVNSNLDRLVNPDFKKLFKHLSTSNIDSIYAKTPLSPEYNDMNWASYFATGDTKFLDKIIANATHAEDRVDRNLFLTGASAQWSLCSNARQDKRVKEHLTALKENKAIQAILGKDPQEFRQEMIDIIKAQRAKGLWN
jgi:hypothetical protein